VLSGRRRLSNMAVALVAAYLLVLQSMASAFAFGDAASLVQLDAFGNVICTHDGAGTLPASDQHQQHMPPCCTFGCTMGSAVLAPPPLATKFSQAVVFETVIFTPLRPVLTISEPRYSPANPRAPPLDA
jgi:hypothetical protein